MDKFPSYYRNPANIVEMERILPLPKIIRRAIISYFYLQDTPLDTHTQDEETLDEETLDEEILDDKTLNTWLRLGSNKHCLVRTYLGKQDHTYSEDTFSLRNFPLPLGKMRELKLDVEELAKQMGSAYAIMHWGAGVNGDDVEFALGSRIVSTSTTVSNDPQVQRRAIGLYLLDFGQCEAVDLQKDPSEIYQAFKGAMVTGDNQSFIPHYTKTPDLFAIFKTAYINAGEAILAAKELSGKFDMDEFMREYEEYAEDFLA